MLSDTRYEVKKIYVFLNGIKYGNCKKLVINSRKISVWMRILDEISLMFDNVIIVSRLFRLDDGLEVFDFNQLQDRGYYVASDLKNLIDLP